MAVTSGRYIGVDPGRRRIGLALSDDAEGNLALPWRTIERGNDDLKAAEKVAAALEEVEGGILGIIIGLPLRLDGSEGHAARLVRRFGDALGSTMDQSPIYWDERMTTVNAERGLRELGLRGSAARKVIDEAAASAILQGFLDAQNQRRFD